MSTRDNRDTHELLVQVCTADACHSGDLPCPCPDACLRPFAEERRANFAVAVALVVACVVVALILSGVLP
jgi:hypothetical protein